MQSTKSNDSSTGSNQPVLLESRSIDDFIRHLSLSDTGTQKTKAENNNESKQKAESEKSAPKEIFGLKSKGQIDSKQRKTDTAKSDPNDVDVDKESDDDVDDDLQFNVNIEPWNWWKDSVTEYALVSFLKTRY